MRGFLSFLIDYLFSRSCLVCGRGIGSSALGALPAGVGASSRMAAFLDAGLRMPLFEGVSVSADVLCAGCWARLDPAPSEGFLPQPAPGGGGVAVVSPYHTNDELLALVKFLKFSGGRAAAPSLGWWMAAALGDFLGMTAGPDSTRPALVPVPLHSRREKERGYNQAALLAREVAGRLGLDLDAGVLERTRSTKAQSTLEQESRAANVRGAFRLARPDLVAARHIVLVDDLVTTGETALACAEALAEGSPLSVTVLAAGRTRKGCGGDAGASLRHSSTSGVSTR